MPLTFPKAPRVAVGDRLTAAQLIGLANAFNARARSGLGDFHWRDVKYEANGFLQVRNSDEFGNTPAMGEFFFLYQLLDGENDPGEWPVMGPGEPEGANVISPFCAFVFGVELAGYPGEEIRISDPAFPLWLGLHPPGTDEEMWDLGKAQRGVIDWRSGDQYSPAIETARSAQFINYTGLITPYGKGYGGEFPAPNELLSDCGSTESDGRGVPSWEIKFTATRKGVNTIGVHGAVGADANGFATVTYSGSCPIWTLNVAAGHVQTIVRFPDVYYVAVYDGTNIVWDVYPTVDWLEGPYTNDGKLSRYDGQHIPRGVWAMINDFRGTPGQRNPDDFDIEKIAFSFEEFHGRQYLLSPQLGNPSGGTNLAPVYPMARSAPAAKVNAGTFLSFVVSGKQSYAYHTGFVLSGMFLKGTGLAAPVTLRVLDGATQVAILSVSPDAPTTLKYIPNAFTPKKLTVELMTEAQFDNPGGQVTIEFTEQLAFKPTYWDAYLLLRQSATKGGFSWEGSFLDGSGVDQAAATQFYKNYLRFGVILNQTAAGIRTIDNAISPNPVYDAARRQSREMVRIARHQEFLTYEVIGGKTVLRFNRFAFGQKNTKADIFHGIAPSYKPVTEVQEGVEYVARSHTGGRITYAGTPYALNQRFRGFHGIKTFTAQGDAQLFEYEGIRADAPRNGWSNEWLMSIETHVYHPSPTSLWKQDSYGDWYLFNNRCMFYAYSMSNDLARFVDLPANAIVDPTWRWLHLSPEAPSGFRYKQGLNQNTSYTTPEFCSSCQIYEQPYEIESSTVEFDPTGFDVVKLVLKTRFRSHPAAAASLSRDANMWDTNNIRVTQDYRTDDNALCELQILRQLGLNGTFKVGDSAAWSYVTGLPDNPFGSIIPRFLFSSLVKKPCAVGVYDDRSRITIEELRKCERKLKVWCEGAIDGVSSHANLCGGGNKPYNYIFENLCKDAFGGREIADFTGGFGPQVNTEFRGSIFNKITSCVDLLNRFNIDGLMQFQARAVNYSTVTDVTPDWGNGGCPPNAGFTWYLSGCPPGAAFQSYGDWGPVGGFTADSGASSSLCGPGGGQIAFGSTKHDVQVRYVTNPGFENAIPAIVQGLIDNNNIGVFGTATRHYSAASLSTTLDILLGSCISSNGQFSNGAGGYFYFPANVIDENLGCVELTASTITAGDAPCGVFAGCSQADPSSGAGWQESPRGGTDKAYTFSRLGDDGFAMIVVPVL